MSAMKIAQTAADEAFSAYLARHKSTATFSVPAEVADAARVAYAGVNGRGSIVVAGRGNATHPVCSVEVRRAK